MTSWLPSIQFRRACRVPAIARTVQVLAIILVCTWPSSLLAVETQLCTAVPYSAPLRGKRVVVTGGGRGFGRSLALLSASEGAQVAILSRSLDEIRAVTQEAKDLYGTDILALQADITKEDEVEATVGRIIDEFGEIDLLVNNAGRNSDTKPSHEHSIAHVREVLDVNIVGAIIVSCAVLRLSMLGRQRGDIINVSSSHGRRGVRNKLPYCVSKFGLHGVTAMLAEDYKDAGISVNAFSPGQMNTRSFPKGPDRVGVRKPEDAKEAFLYLVEQSSKGTTGRFLHAADYEREVLSGDPAAAFKTVAT
eukprot:TRINITY_DN73208_c0_g1_i1.p1 TRINITY_DN73208_c0_g1~~TRINITY_DN73208_c0_g1_i1.p1  ORF type:complete len:306 (+),score=13.16 TRINITY_DN73208_c0_g1_i1:157-1074(+)